MEKVNEDYTFFQSPEFQSSLAAYERMAAGGQKADLDAESLTDVAEYYSLMRRPEEARRCIKYALSLYPDSIDPKIFLSREEMFRGNMSEAMRICKSIGADDDREVMFLRAELLLHEGKTEQAFKAFLRHYRGIEEDQEAAECACDFADLCKDYSYDNMGMQVVSQVCVDYPDYLPGQALKAEFYSTYGDYDKAEVILKRIIREDPFCIHYWAMLAQNYMWGNNLTDATDATDYALAIDPDNIEALNARACVLHELEQYDEAHQLFERLLKAFPNDSQMRMLDAQCAIELGLYGKAIERLELDVISPHLHGHALSCLAFCHYQLGQDLEYNFYREEAEKRDDNTLYNFFPDLYPSPAKRHEQNSNDPNDDIELPF